MKGRTTGLALAVVFSAVLAVPAMAMDIRVDFNTAATNPTGNWNIQAAPGTMTNLIDYGTGTGSGVDMAVTGDVQISSQNTEWDPSNPGPAWLDTAKDAAMDYYWLSSTSTAQVGLFTFSGLTAGQAYRLELIASSDSTSVGNAEYSVNSVFFDGSSDGLYNFSDGYYEGTWLTWSSVTANGSGELVLRIDTLDGSGRGRANALQLTEIPEPTSMALLGLGGLMGVLRRRRRA